MAGRIHKWLISIDFCGNTGHYIYSYSYNNDKAFESLEVCSLGIWKVLKSYTLLSLTAPMFPVF